MGKPLAWVGEQLDKGGRWLQQNWQTVAIIAIACVMPAATVWYAAALQGAAMGALSAALYRGGPDEILRGALIGGATGGGFAETALSSGATNGTITVGWEEGIHGALSGQVGVQVGPNGAGFTVGVKEGPASISRAATLKMVAAQGTYNFLQNLEDAINRAIMHGYCTGCLPGQ